MAKTKLSRHAIGAAPKSGSSFSWYLKYRPKVISELDQENVKEVLSDFIKSGRIPHALLFAGPKGTGKTSAARIIAKILNCTSAASAQALSEPCNQCDSCRSINSGSSFSVMELDGASNRGIEDIRAIREAVKLSVPGKFRVYIIDEAHMLTIEAANALLKTLEEPPPHVVFILATTEGYRLPDTIRSRATTISFKKASSAEILHALARVTLGEKIEIDESKLLEVVRLANGSFRDAIKILEQVASGGGKLSILPENSVDNFINALSKKEMTRAIEEIGKAEESGIGMRDFLVSITLRLRKIMMVKLGVETPDEGEIPDIDTDSAKRLAELFIESARFIVFSPVQSLPLELVVVEWCGGENDGGVSHSTRLLSNSDPSASLRTGRRDLRAAPGSDSSPLGPSSNKDNLRSSNATPPPKGRVESGEISEELWRKILDEVKVKNHTIAALLRSAKPLGMNDGKMQIGVFYAFHKDRLEENKNRAIVEEVSGQLFGRNIKIEFILGEKREVGTRVLARTEKSKEDNLESAAEEIFGGKVGN